MWKSQYTDSFPLFFFLTRILKVLVPKKKCTVTRLIIECTAFIDFLCTYTMALYPGLKNRYHFLYGFFLKDHILDG